MHKTESTSRYWLYMAQVVILAGVYFGAAKVGLSLASVKEIVSLVWPPSGIALAALLLFGYRLWPAIALGALLANISAGASWAAVGISAGNTLEALMGAYVLHHGLGFRNSLERLRDVLGLVALAAMISPLLSATIGVASLGLHGDISMAAYGSTWGMWWLGDAMGILLVAPVLLTWGNNFHINWRLPRLIEAAALLASLIAVSEIVFSGWLASSIITTAPLSFTLFPLLVWAALRFGQRGAALTTLIGAGIAIWGTAHGFGPFVLETVPLSLAVLSSFIAIAAVTTMILAVAITKHKQTQEALRNQEISLRQSEEKYRLVVESSLQGISIIRNNRIVFVNPAMCQIMGYSAAELTSFSAEQILATVYPEDRAIAMERYRARLQGQLASSHNQYRIVRRDGTLRWIETSILPMLYEDELSLLSISLDITEYKQAEEALRASEERYRSLFEESPIPISEQDFSLVKAYIEALQSQGVTNFKTYFEHHPQDVAHCLKLVKIINLNKSSVELYQANSKEELMRDLSLLLTQESYKSFTEILIAIAQGKTRLEQETINRTLTGEPKNIALSWAVLPGYEETFSKVLISLVNMTEHKRLEEQLRQAQKMEAIGRLAGGVAHDFNNILTVIKGYAELLLQKLDVHDPLSHDISQIQKSAQRAAALTRQLLAFSRKQVLQPVVLDFNTIVTNMDQMLRRLIGEDIQLMICLEPALGRVKADPGLMEQMIMNLAVNAREAMPNGGQFTIETANVELDEAYTRRQLEVKPGSYIRLTLTDTGHGMDVETCARIFEPFFTTKEQGTGLGLATVHGIINQSGGHIRVYSEPGQGTSFEVYLPRVEEETNHWVKSHLQDMTSSTRGSETILLVEDEPLVRELVCRALLNKGYTVLEASNGEEAIHVAQQHQGTIDLLVTDVVMPGGMSGRQLVERLTPLRREMKVLYISGYTDDVIVHHGVLDAGLAFLQKPFTSNHLADKVREVLDTPQEIRR